MSENTVKEQQVADTAQPKNFEQQLCQYLVEQGRLKDEDLQRGLRLNKESFGVSLVPLLVRLGLASERDVAQSLHELLEYPIISDKDIPESTSVDVEFPIRYMRESQFVPLEENDDELTVVMVYPYEDYLIKGIKMVAQKKLNIKIGLPSDVENAIERYYGGGKSAMGQLVEGLANDGGEIEDVEHLKDLASEAPVIRLVNMIMQRAVESRASDIHIEPFENRLKVRYRLDGVLHEVESPPARSTAAVISRIKIMAKLNIAERRLPQDGRIMLRVQGKELDLRVSTVPTSYGESVVMRILDRESIVFDFNQLGFRKHTLDPFLKVLEMPHGILLVTGPTGSGKTTTLYTALQRLNTEDRKIITVEDPVEYQLTGINQIQAKASIGLDFSSALRAIVRQDPDIIMIGEMRDLETATMAVQASLTGHLVLSTLHTNDAPSSINRLLDLGVPDYLLRSTLAGVLAQRLIRLLCPHCKKSNKVDAEKWVSMVHPFDISPPIELFEAVGCDECRNTGYHGRSGVFEMMPIDQDIRKLIKNDMPSEKVTAAAYKQGMLPLRIAIAKLLKDGKTSLEEAIRLAPPDLH